MTEPIMIPCEGSGGFGLLLGPRDIATNLYMCQMCGATFLAPYNRMPRHDRQDILAMLDRGDFDT